MLGKYEVILIVENDADLADTCASLLRLFGYEVEIASGAKSAMETMNVRLPQLLLADDSMPDMTGLQLCQSLRRGRDKAQFPIILMSARGRQIADPEQACDAFLCKPFRAETLIGEVRRLIGPPKILAGYAGTTLH